MICKITIFYDLYCLKFTLALWELTPNSGPSLKMIVFQMNNSAAIKILLAPLDWGLGHATRCIPLIRSLQQKGCEVVLAAEAAPARLLAAEFPGIRIIQLAGYGIRYSPGSSLFASMLLQLPGIFNRIKKEQQWLSRLLQQEEFDVVISDNRPGFRNKKTYCIYITHQLLIHSGKGTWLNRMLQVVHTRYMKKFSEVWVPDLSSAKNLAGELSHPPHPLIHPVYIGLLSRLTETKIEEEQYDLTVLLSGPEPQRTILEQKILQQLQAYPGRVLFVRGLPQQTQPTVEAGRFITVHNHLPADELQRALCSSAFIICRSGYTTLMDLVKLNKKALLIPTPGQPEQEYLARYMQKQSYFPFQEQQAFDLSAALKTADAFAYRHLFTEADFEIYNKVIDRLLSSRLHNQSV